jgi:hypothetical protein
MHCKLKFGAADSFYELVALPICGIAALTFPVGSHPYTPKESEGHHLGLS